MILRSARVQYVVAGLGLTIAGIYSVRLSKAVAVSAITIGLILLYGGLIDPEWDARLLV